MGLWSYSMPRSVLLLDAVDESARALGEICRIGFIGVDVHGEREVCVDANTHVAKNELAVAGYPDAHAALVPQAIAQSIAGGHVDVAQGADHALVDGDAAVGSLQRAAG